MADKPARALIIHGDGFMKAIRRRHSNLHGLAAAGSCGFLALRCGNNSDSEANRVLEELAQLLDIHDEIKVNAVLEDDPEICAAGRTVDSGIPLISDRFMGINAGMFSNFQPAIALAQKTGFAIFPLQEGSQVNDDLPKPSLAASHVLNALGLSDLSESCKQPSKELIWLHLVAGKQGHDGEEHLSSKEVDWVDELLGELQKLTQPGTEAAKHLYVAVVLGFGAVWSLRDMSKENDFCLVGSGDELTPELSQIRPLQSYLMKGGKTVGDIREHHPLLVAHQLEAVTRKDQVRAFGFDEFQKHSGSLTILADRFLHEVAFKLWKAPKYGA